MGTPDTTCQPNRPSPARLAPIWIVRAVSSPFCIFGTVDTAMAHKITNPAPAYRCGPGNSFPALAYVLRGPSIAKNVPRNAKVAPWLKCWSRGFSEANCFRSAAKPFISASMEVAASYFAIRAVSSASFAVAIASAKDEADPMPGRVFFKSLISLPSVRCRLQLNPKRAVETENPNIPNIMAGCRSERVFPLKMVTSRMFAAISREDAK
mmetsp:Transcript_13005/g.19141  ORF Transcript_13005/g.19141 Transcript_13005/m.19141 type:complete len:209 (+) Transcript_13005:366-992(+)